MAVSLTNLNDVIVSQTAIDQFVAHLCPMSAFSRSYSPDTARKGDTITVPLIANITATTAENAYESADSGAMTGVNLTLNVYRKSTVAITDTQWHDSSAVDISRFSYQLTASVARAFTDQVFSLEIGRAHV